MGGDRLNVLPSIEEMFLESHPMLDHMLSVPTKIDYFMKLDSGI